MRKPLSQTWDLDVIFPGGSESSEFASFLASLEKEIADLQQQIAVLNEKQAEEAASLIRHIIMQAQQLQSGILHSQSFAGCLAAQNVKDQVAKLRIGRVNQIAAAYQSLLTTLDERIVELPDPAWERLLQDEELAKIAFPLEERRRLATEKLPAAEESLANDLAVDGYHAWSELYDTVVGRITITVEENGEKHNLSVGQAFNKLSHADRAVRQDVFAKWESAWADEAELCAAALNHLAGFRLNLYRHRGWTSILKEPLDVNRMSEQTLNVMWEVIERNKAHFVEYLHRKAKLLKLDALGWEDVTAPLSSDAKAIAYDDAAEFIVEQFNRFSPKMADFAVHAFENSWIEAENRTGKRPGGFCTGFPVAHKTRIFMTYSGNSDNVSTLAHELGHAYHQFVMEDMPPMAQNYAMNVAETASTFAEMIIMDAAVKSAKDDTERIALIEEKIQNSIAFYMNIHARFLFETRFYQARKEGLVTVEQLNELMVQAQKEAYRDALASYHPHFWASKLHFYITDVPFYNFPYTFGYLFSSGIYALAMREGAGFEQKYVNLLRDTGSMTVEDLAARHLGVDLTQPDFWQNAVDLSLADVEEFLRLTERM